MTLEHEQCPKCPKWSPKPYSRDVGLWCVRDSGTGDGKASIWGRPLKRTFQSCWFTMDLKWTYEETCRIVWDWGTRIIGHRSVPLTGFVSKSSFFLMLFNKLNHKQGCVQDSRLLYFWFLALWGVAVLRAPAEGLNQSHPLLFLTFITSICSCP